MDIKAEFKRVIENHGLDTESRREVSKHLLALDIVKEISEQSANSSDLFMILSHLLYALSGQLGIPNGFVQSFELDSLEEGQVFVGIGDLEESSLSDELHIKSDLMGMFPPNEMLLFVEEIQRTDRTSAFLDALMSHGIEALVPLISRGITLAIVGLGARVNDRRLSNEDQIIVSAVMDAVSPIISNRIREFFGIFHSSNQAVFILGHDFEVQNVNNTAVLLIDRIAGSKLTCSAIRGKFLKEVLDPSLFAGWIEAISERAINANVHYIRNLKVDNNGSQLFFEAFLTKINSRNERAYSLMLTLDDVTAKKTRGQRIAEMQRAAERGQMLSSIAHELNNHLGLLTGHIDLVSHASISGDTTKVQEKIEDLRGACKSVAKFVGDLVGRNRQTTRKTRANLNTLIEDCLKVAQAQERFKEIDLRLELSQAQTTIIIDTDEITQVVLNIVNNAADALIEVERKGVVTVQTSVCDKYVHLKICDNGPGIRPEIRNRLFQESFTTKKDGHGFGLTVCSTILKDHYAKYGVESKLGRGSIFKISFPILVDDSPTHSSIDSDQSASHE